MIDREDMPTDLFDAICRLDDIADWLESESYTESADALRDVSYGLKGFIQIRIRLADSTDTQGEAMDTRDSAVVERAEETKEETTPETQPSAQGDGDPSPTAAADQEHDAGGE